MTTGYLVTTIIAAGALSTTILATPPVLLTWNTTASMPIGLYRIVRADPTRGEVVLSRLPASIEARAVALGILRPGVPVVKRIAAMAGDVACRFGSLLTINGHSAAILRRRERHEHKLPIWHGCRRLAATEVLLLGRHPDSFDGRYFGPTNIRLCVGVARPLLIGSHQL